MSTKEDYNLSRPRIACPNCGRGITKACYDRHVSVCLKNQSQIQRESYKLDHDGLNCKFCGKLCKSTNSLIQHEIRCKDNPRRNCHTALQDHVANNVRGQTKHTSLQIRKQSERLQDLYASGELIPASKGKPGSFSGYKHSIETKRKIGEHVSASRKAGYASGRITPAKGVGCGKYSYIQYKDRTYMLRSTYEFIYALYLLKNGIEFELEAIRVPATDSSTVSNSTFISDFSYDNKVVEIKGIPSEKDSCIKDAFESAGYTFVELFESDIAIYKEWLKSNDIPIDELLVKIKEHHDKKDYFVFTFDN